MACTDLEQAKAKGARPTSAYSRSRHIERNADVRISLELGEDPEHLDHHPPRRRRGVKGLGSRAKRHSGGIEFFEQRARPRTERAKRSTR